MTAATIASWMRRLDEHGEAALVQTPSPVNRFPDFVTAVVQELRAVATFMGRRKIAAVLARAGLHLAPTTVARLCKRRLPASPPAEPGGSLPAAPARPERPCTAGAPTKPRVVTARYPHHLWHVDLTLVPALGGFWVPWLPGALLPLWPFCWSVAVVLDHFTRSVVAHGVFPRAPTAAELCAVLDRAAAAAGRAPRHIVSHRGSQFTSDDYRAWCDRRGARPRFGAVGQHGSIAVVERFIRTLKDECLRTILVPLSRPRMIAELDAYLRWYHTARPHAALGGATPAERLAGTVPACQGPALEPRPRYPLAPRARAPGAPPRRRIRGRLELVLTHVGGHRHLPVAALRDVA